MTPAPEKILVRRRTHGKVLFWPAVIQIVLLAAHVALAIVWPADGFGIAWVRDWGQLTVHGLIACIEVGYAILPFLRWWNAVFTVTNHRVSRQWGILWKNSYETPIDRITSVSLERGLLDRIFGCGTLVLNDSAHTYAPRKNYSLFSRATGDGRGDGVRFYDIPHVKQVQATIDSLRYGTPVEGDE